MVGTNLVSMGIKINRIYTLFWYNLFIIQVRKYVYTETVMRKSNIVLCNFFFRRNKMKNCYSDRDAKENLHREGLIWAELPSANNNLNGGKEEVTI